MVQTHSNSSPLPKLPRGDAGTFHHGGELCPDHIRINSRLPDPGAVAAVATGDDVLAADQIGISGDALGNQLRMFDKIRLRLDDAWDQHLSLGELRTFEQR